MKPTLPALLLSADGDVAPAANGVAAGADAPVAAEPTTPPAQAGRPRAGGAGPDKFPVVALCGSAGALAALEQFFAHLAPASGLAFVVVMPQGPAPAGQLARVLQGFTPLPVAEATDGLKVRPNHVYVLPPAHDLSLLHGSLFLLPPTQPAAQRLPIDFFLQTLARDAGERAACVIFSGLGADGAVGLKLVMENFGMVMVQDPATAAFDAMPRAALATGFVDFVLPPALLPAQLLDYAGRPLAARAPVAGPAAQPAHALQKILLLIRDQTGHDFSLYKRNTVLRRIERRMNAHRLTAIPHYVCYLQENPAEVEQLFRELLIGVTKFFRDAEAFASLRERLGPLLLRKEAHGTVRVWAPGCSTGEEAYSLAMTLLESLDGLGPGCHLQIQVFATDISAQGIDFARAGQYGPNIAADVSPERLARFFQQTNGHYHIRKEVRAAVVFALHDINKDAPFTKLDLLVCRNLLIYLSGELQRKLLPVFHYALNPGGLLFLGPSENLTGFQDLFRPLDVKWKISQRTETPAALTRLANFPLGTARAPLAAAHPAVAMPAAASPRATGLFAGLAQKALLDAYAPAAVIVNQKGEILYVNGHTGAYLEPAPGPSGLNVFEMARDGLRFEISGAVRRAVETREAAVVEGVRVQTAAGQQLVRLSVRPLAAPDALAGLLLVAFEDQPTPRRVCLGKGAAAATDRHRDAVVSAPDTEPRYTKHRLQATIEEMESSLEELQSANKELKSTNEEAMTNKEAMESLNEELMTLNTQYLAKTDELSQAASDMKNLLDATGIAVIFLDNDLAIKRFTPPVGRIISLVPTDVGRPLAHFASRLRYEHLLRDVRQVLDRLVGVEVNLQTTGGEWYTMRVLPYRSLDNYINGAVVTFTGITALKQLEERLQETARFAQSMQEMVLQPVLALDAELRVYLATQAFAQTFGGPAAALHGQPLARIGGGAWNQPALLGQLRQLLDPAGPVHHFDGLVLTADFAGLGRRRAVLYGRRLLHQGQPTGRVLLGVQALEEVA